MASRMGSQGGGGQTSGGRGRGDARPPFAGMRIILSGFSSPIEEKCNSKILKMGGTVLGSMDYGTATHIAVPRDAQGQEGAKLIWTGEGKKVIYKDWIDMCYSRGKLLQQSDNLGVSALEPSVGFEEEVYHRHHQLFVCKEDQSDWTSLLVYSIINKDNLTTEIPTPGSSGKHYSVTTSNELKLHARNSLKLMKSLHKVGLTLGGKFSADNFVVDSYNNMRLRNLPKGVIKKLNDGDSDIDTRRFVGMIKTEIFSGKRKPSDMLQWLDLVTGCEAAFDDLATNYISLMDEYKGAAHFMSLYDMFEDMESSDPDACRNVKKDLAKYTNWQTLLRGQGGNYYLIKTLNYRDKTSGKPYAYADDISGLLKLLRNSRRHAARAKEGVFALIVGHHFPELMGDFQKAMFKQEYIIPEN